ncbi:MAG: hypothetical protein IJ062_10385 [Firmicutes bacterium]|nr:hypothetical protein [Bacillota bacterium]
MKKLDISLKVSIISFCLAVLCFAGFLYREELKIRHESALARSFRLESIYHSAQLCITERYAAKGIVMDSLDTGTLLNDHYLWSKAEGYNIVTVEGAPLISYVEYKGYKYPEIDKESDIYYLSEDVDDFDLHAEEFAQRSLAPALYAAAWCYIRENDTSGMETIPPEDLLEKVDFLAKEPKKAEYIKKWIHDIEIRLCDNGAAVEGVSFGKENYSPDSMWWYDTMQEPIDKEIAKNIYAAAVKYLSDCNENGTKPEIPLECEFLAQNGYIDPLPDYSSIYIYVENEDSDDIGIKGVFVGNAVYPS